MTDARQLKIHETTTDDGTLAPVFLAVEAGALVLVSEEERVVLPPGALEAVMRRYGAPLDPVEEARLASVATLELGGGATLRHVRHLARWDVIARDYLVFEAQARGHGGYAPSCALATTVTGALQHLARAAGARATLGEGTHG